MCRGNEVSTVADLIDGYWAQYCIKVIIFYIKISAKIGLYLDVTYPSNQILAKTRLEQRAIACSH